MEREQKPKPDFGFVGPVMAGVTAIAMTLFFMGAVAAPLRENVTQETVAVSVVAGQRTRQVVPLGRAVGIKLFSDGVLVVGTSSVDTAAGKSEPGKAAGLKAGDIITSIDEQDVNTIEQVQEILKTCDGEALTLQVMRGEKTIQLAATPAENPRGGLQLGVWLRDSMAGIGTMTFYDPETGVFGALGHGVNDMDTAMLMPLESGSIMYASVKDVQKGASGNPGELHGEFDVGRDMGDLYANTDQGLYGTLTSHDMEGIGEAMDVATRSEVKEGAATIRSNIRGDEVEEFTIDIIEIHPEMAGETKNMMIEVTDPRLLENTGGIVQGMSGSPIIQNGKIIGAVTHVLVNDPTKGYGILIENMLEASENIVNTAN